MKKFPEEKIGLSKGSMRELATYVHQVTSDIETRQDEQNQQLDGIERMLSNYSRALADSDKRIEYLNQQLTEMRTLSGVFVFVSVLSAVAILFFIFY